jgi:hypothetical protein
LRIKYDQRYREIGFMLKYRINGAARFREIFTVLSGVWVSLYWRAIAMTSTAENTAQKANIVSIFANFIKTVPRRGPMIKPIPKIAPRSPKFLLRSSGVFEISASTA